MHIATLLLTMTPNLDRLLDIMARLRDREHGCPWDVEQTFATIAPYTIEEAYEVADAITRDDMAALKDELGDLLLQVVFHAQMAHEADLFAFDDVAAAIVEKLARRHPHVFGDEAVDHAALRGAWEAHKSAERATKADREGRRTRLLDDVPIALPALTRAEKLQKRAATVGFDWPDTGQVTAKIEEELGELQAELADGADAVRVHGEVGDLLFACANLARHLGVDPETALRGCNTKFERRFGHIEKTLTAQGRALEDASLEEMEALWQEAKTGDPG